MQKVLRGFKGDKSHIDKLNLFPVDLKELRDVLEKEVFKKDVYDELVKKKHWY